jgi:primary-amine oxidase
VLNFKLDLDVNGTENTLQRVDFTPVTTRYQGGQAPINTMKLEKTFIRNETQGKMNWYANKSVTIILLILIRAPNSGSLYVVVNRNATNKFGELKGYRISPGVGSPIYLTPKNSTSAGRTASWASHHLYVTKRKDTEQRSARSWNVFQKDSPFIDFDQFFDGENIDQEDM